MLCMTPQRKAMAEYATELPTPQLFSPTYNNIQETFIRSRLSVKAVLCPGEMPLPCGVMNEKTNPDVARTVRYLHCPSRAGPRRNRVLGRRAALRGRAGTHLACLH